MADSTTSTAADADAKVEETASTAADDVRQAATEAATQAKDTAQETPRPKPPSRSPEEIAADLERARQSLVSNMDAIQEYVKPANILERGTRKLRRIYVTQDGSPKVKSIAVTAAVVGIYVLYRIRKK